MKIFIFIILLISFVLLPFINTLAITPGTVPDADELGIPKSPIETSQGLLDISAEIAQWIYTIFFIVAVIYILLAAFNYLFNSAAPDKIQQVHSQLIYAAVAIAIALLAVSFEAIVKDILGG